MNYKIVIYIISVFSVAFAMSGLNINNIFKKGHVVEANVFVLIMILALSELVSEFIINFLEVSKIIQ